MDNVDAKLSVTQPTPEKVPMYKELYCGFIPKPGEIRTGSDAIVVKDILDNSLDPHDLKHSNNLLWTTPDSHYAKGIAVTKFKIKMSLNSELAEAVRNGAQDILPRFAVYKIKPDTKLFDAENKTMVPIEDNPKTQQIIIDSVDPQDIEVKTLHESSVKRILAEIDEKVNLNTEIIGRICRKIDRTMQTNFLGDNNTDEEMTLGEAIAKMANYYIGKGMTKEHVEDVFAGEMFANSLENYHQYTFGEPKPSGPRLTKLKYSFGQ